MFNEVEVTLISYERMIDEYANEIKRPVEKNVIATIKSTSQKEFYNAGIAGFKAEKVIILWEFDYNNEDTVVIDNIVYSIYRTYTRQDEHIELYLTKKVGVKL